MEGHRLPIPVWVSKELGPAEIVARKGCCRHDAFDPCGKLVPILVSLTRHEGEWVSVHGEALTFTMLSDLVSCCCCAALRIVWDQSLGRG